MKMYTEYLIGLEHYSIEALCTSPHLVFPTILEVILLLLLLLLLIILILKLRKIKLRNVNT